MATLEFREADLSQPPIPFPPDDTTHVALGDLHSNPLKLVYTLAEEGILKLSPDDYNQLWSLYNIPVDALTEADLALFEDIIKNKTVVSTEKSLTLIGDELADRGANDYFTLLVLEKLCDTPDLDFEVLLSNHGLEFLRCISTTGMPVTSTYPKHQIASLLNLKKLMQKKPPLLTEEKIDKIYEKYQSHLKLLSYSLEPPDQVTLFTHAPVGLETIAAVAAKLGVTYADTTPSELFATIDSINLKFTAGIIDEYRIVDVIEAEEALLPNGQSLPEVNKYPFCRLLWNREVGEELITTPTNNNYSVHFSCGHVGPKPIQQKVNGQLVPLVSHTTLDTYFGKGMTQNNQTNTKVTHCTWHSKGLTELRLFEAQQQTQLSSSHAPTLGVFSGSGATSSASSPSNSKLQP